MIHPLTSNLSAWIIKDGHPEWTQLGIFRIMMKPSPGAIIYADEPDDMDTLNGIDGEFDIYVQFAASGSRDIWIPESTVFRFVGCEIYKSWWPHPVITSPRDNYRLRHFIHVKCQIKYDKGSWGKIGDFWHSRHKEESEKKKLMEDAKRKNRSV